MLPISPRASIPPHRTGRSRTAIACAAAAVLGCAAPVLGVDRTWVGGTSVFNWAVASAWNPAGVPPADDNVFINTFSFIQTPSSGSGAVARTLTMSGGASVATGQTPLTVGLTTTLSGPNDTFLNVFGTNTTTVKFQTATLTINSPAYLSMSGGLANITSRVTNNGDIQGRARPAPPAAASSSSTPPGKSTSPAADSLRPRPSHATAAPSFSTAARFASTALRGIC